MGEASRCAGGDLSIKKMCINYSSTLWYFNIAMENGHLWLIYPLNIVIFHSYVKLPEGNGHDHG